jgi:hypothetical protein
MSRDQALDTKRETEELRDKIDLVFKIIGRFDFYLNSTNAKASLVIAWNGVIIGTVIFKYDSIVSAYSNTWSHNAAVVLLSLVGLFSLISLRAIFKVVFPYLEPGSSVKQDESSLFFGTIAKLGPADYHSRLMNSSLESILSDAADQASTLAMGLNEKMERLQDSISFVNYGLVLIFGFVLLKGAETLWAIWLRA